MNCKAKGNRRERQSRKLLEAAGYRCMKAGASLGVFDLIGIGAADVVCIQVKSNAWPRSAEMATLAAFSTPPNVRKIIHRWRDGVGVPDMREVGTASQSNSISTGEL